MRLTFRSSENILRLTLDEEPGDAVERRALDGCIDIAEQGRLVGIELGAESRDFPEVFAAWLQDSVAREYVEIDENGVYVALSAPSETIPEQHIRTADLRLTIELDANNRLVAIAIPRRGHGYEISFPSGNQ